MNPISMFMNLSPAGRIAVCLLGGATPLGILAMFTPGSLFMLLFLVMAFIGMILLIWKVILKRMDKAKGKQMERGLKEQAAAAPSGAADAASRARMDDLRKSWEEGIAKFRERGKDLYSVPWYMMVGESGSGKTEAIRHCNVGFPPGLQDKLQGSGGTLNMHWWFTNQSVIIDTAGRLLQDSGRQEWRQFLKMLRKARPLRPVNGLLLVIPADSLIKDTGDDLERKGGRIASALDEIQDELGVRFPVYLIITKCDLINGFREYFDAMPDPELKLQEQMLGWSNPAPLDEAFNPGVVDQHLKTIRDRLVQRRYQLLLDPVNTEDATRRRTEQVDALFAFPDALMSLAPRLRRYLEMVFVAGEWSRKPLFIRGIYFTSSMQEGAALDAELADALGVKIADLQQENVAAKREKTFFLRDVFVSKVFKEQGLVTAAVNVKKSQGSQRLLLLGSGFLAAVLGLGLTIWSWMGLQEAIGSSSSFWADASKVLGGNFENAEIIYGEGARNQYYGAVKVADVALPTGQQFGQGLGDAGNIPLAEVPAQTLQQVVREGDRRVPFIFKPIAAITGGDPFARQREAHGAVYHGLVLAPLVDAAQRKMNLEAAAAAEAPWTPEATAALAQLIRLEASQVNQAGMLTEVGMAAVSGALPATPGAAPPPAPSAANLQNAGGQLQGSLDVASTIRDRGGVPSVGALLRYALERSDPNPSLTPELLAQQIATLEDVSARTYQNSADGAGLDWKPAAEDVINDATHAAVRAGVARFIDDWQDRTSGGNSEQLGRLIALRDALERFDRAEQALWLPTGLRDAATRPQYRDAASEWTRLYNETRAANDALRAAITALGSDVSNLEAVSAAARTQLLDDATRAFDALRREIPGGLAPTAVIRAEHSAVLQEADQKLRQGINQINTDVGAKIEAILATLRTLQPNLLDRIGSQESGAYAFERRFRMYEAANARILAAGAVDDAPPTLTVLELAALLGDADAEADRARAAVTAAAQDRPGVAAFSAAQTTSDRAIAAASRKIRYDAIAASLRGVTSAADVQDLVSRSATAPGVAPVVIQGLPMTRWTDDEPVDPDYSPIGAKAAFAAIAAAGAAAAPGAAGSESSPASPRVLEQEEIARLLDQASALVAEYAEDYLRYWTQTLPQALAVQPMSKWTDFRTQMTNIVPRNIARDADTNAKVFQDALNALQPALLDEQSREDHTRALGIAAHEISERGGDQDRATELIENLSSLGLTAGEARTRILASTKSSFVQRYLSLFYPVGEDVEIVRYWKSLTYAAFSSIATESSGEAFEALVRLRTQHRAFPLCADESRTLTAQQLQEVLRDVNALASAPAASTAAPGVADTIGHRDTRVSDRPMDQVIDALRGGSLINEQNRVWFNKVRALVTELAGGPEAQRLTFDLVILSSQQAGDLQARNAAGGAPASDNFRFLNVRIGTQRRSWTTDTTNDAGGVRSATPNTCPGLPIPNTEPVNLEFAQRSEDRPGQPLADRGGQTLPFSDPWAALRLITRPGAFVASDGQPATAQEWRVPLSLTLNGQPLQYWVGIRFSRPIPVPAQWPTSAEWPPNE